MKLKLQQEINNILTIGMLKKIINEQQIPLNAKIKIEKFSDITLDNLKRKNYVEITQHSSKYDYLNSELILVQEVYYSKIDNILIFLTKEI